jgi:hypothetical protein
LLAVRAVREQLDWAEIRKAVQNEPFAEAFLFLVERLGIIAPFDAGVLAHRATPRSKFPTIATFRHSTGYFGV